MLHFGKSIVSEKCEQYIDRTFRNTITKPEGIIKLFRTCEARSLEFVSAFFGSQLPEPEIRYITKDEVEPERRDKYGFISSKTKIITLLVDNIFKKIVHHPLELELSFSTYIIHEIEHWRDAQTNLFNIKEALYAKRDSLLSETHNRTFCRLFKKKNPDLEAVRKQIIALEAMLEGRASRLEWLAMEKRIGKSIFPNLDVSSYLWQMNGWDIECAWFIKFLEMRLGTERAWRITEEIIPDSIIEIEKPELYLSKVLAKDIRNSN